MLQIQKHQVSLQQQKHKMTQSNMTAKVLQHLRLTKIWCGLTTIPDHKQVHFQWTNRVYRILVPTLKVFGQCMLGLAIILILIGVALCIWGYVGEPIRPFQIFGPLCIAIGLLIYISGCIMCCRKHPTCSRTLGDKVKKERIQEAITLLMDGGIISYIQKEPDLLEDFKEVTSRVLDL